MLGRTRFFFFLCVLQRRRLLRTCSVPGWIGISAAVDDSSCAKHAAVNRRVGPLKRAVGPEESIRVFACYDRALPIAVTTERRGGVLKLSAGLRRGNAHARLPFRPRGGIAARVILRGRGTDGSGPAGAKAVPECQMSTVPSVFPSVVSSCLWRRLPCGFVPHKSFGRI